MKKILLPALLFGAFLMNGQVLLNEDFSTFTKGPLDDIVNDVNLGQNGWAVLGGANATPDAVLIAGSPDQFLAVDAAVAGESNSIVKPLAALWATRKTGNENFVFRFYFEFPGVDANSEQEFEIVIMDKDSKRIGGLLYSVADGKLKLVLGDTGLATVFNNTSTQPTGSYFDFLYEKATGKLTLKVGSTTLPAQSAPVGKTPQDLVIYSSSSSNSSVATYAIFDDIYFRAQSDTNLSVNENLIASKISVSPNPAKDFVTISTDNSLTINKVDVLDINGRLVQQNIFDNISNTQINISDLSSGLYFMKISSNKGTLTKKIEKN